MSLNTNQKFQPIGVMDSGLGGLSVLRRLVKLMPHEDFIYFGDSANAPYGTKDAETVYRLTKNIVEMFVKKYNVKAIVIACNTATSVAAKRLREEYNFPIIGLEPAIKPAVNDFPHGRVITMATELTLSGKLFADHVRQLNTTAQIIKVPAPQLVEFVENGELNTSAVVQYLHLILDRDLPADAVVLGCTHFPFEIHAIKQVVGSNVKIYDGGIGASKHLELCLTNQDGLTTQTEKGKVILKNSDSRKIPLMEQLLND